MSVNIVSGLLGTVAIKHTQWRNLIASVSAIGKPLSHVDRTLGHACLGEQSFFFKVHFVSGVTVSGVTMLYGNTTDRMVTPLTFDRSFGVFHTGEMRNVNRSLLECIHGKENVGTGQDA